jgi:ABC-2 type transport system permease protein
MNRLKIIIAHEYMMIVGKKSFIVMTILIPFLMILCGAIPIAIAYFNDQSDTSAETVAVIDESNGYGRALADNGKYKFVNLTGNSAANPRTFYDKANGSVSAVIVIPRDILEKKQVNVYSENTIDVSMNDYINERMSDTLTAAKVASYGVPNLQKMIDESSIDVDTKNIKWSDDGSETESSSEIAMVIGMVLSLFIYTFVLTYGAMIMNNVVEEKTNRIVEVIVSSCKPVQLMMGKIIGVALVGLTQMAIWIVLLAIAGSGFAMLGLHGMSPGAMSTATTAASNGPSITSIMSSILAVNYIPIVINFILYFIGGYFLYAAMFAGFGSAVDQASDASQFTMPIIIIMIIALYAGIACADNPNGPMAVWCSIIPFTSPVVMMVRLPYDVPFWQLVLSIVVLYATAALIVWLSARIYRTGILLYGKKHSLKNVIKWIK